MPIINPIFLDNWQPNTPIVSAEARAEFMNVYTLLNGDIDASNIADNSITTNKLQDGAVTGDKLDSVPASKITGRLALSNLPTSILDSAGGTVTGTFVFDVPQSTALLKNYEDEEVVLYEGGTGDAKIKLIVGGTSVLRITRGADTLWSLENDGLTTPKALKIPLEPVVVTP